jgi:hypothetical protein
MTMKSSQRNTTHPNDAPPVAKRRYSPPRILMRESVEVIAAACDTGGLPAGKATRPPCDAIQS